ncbi:coil containing protein [Vibrio phage 1.239.O._10N.261.52.F6]|nr:coil containing protein [Vibrio phage 1.239.O._10N.261.52.F6]
MKMSEVFDLPVSKHIDVCDIRSISEIAFSADVIYPEYVFKAINSHDSMSERIAQLEADKAELIDYLKELEKALLASTCAFECFYDLDSQNIDPFHVGEYEAVSGVVRRNKELLEKHKESEK